jgi:DNA-directed RNA polymerase specialized sigma24 family protein
MEDKLLIWKFKRGSREALRRIYDKYHGHLLKLAVVLTGNADTAEDVVQEVFVNFAQSADRFGLAVTLRMRANMTFRQIARLQKTSISTVNGRYRYGIEKLRSLLNSEVTV